MNNIPKGVAPTLRRICDSDKNFDIRNSEYQNYLIARDCNISLVEKEFHSVKDRCGVAKHFLTKCTDEGKIENIEFHLIDQV